VPPSRPSATLPRGSRLLLRLRPDKSHAGEGQSLQDRAAQLVASGTLAIVAAPPPPAFLAGWDLGPGETSVLALASTEPGSIAVVDDAAARRCANSLGIPTRGTLSVLVQAKRAGLLAEVAPVMSRVREAGLYLSERLVREVLEQARE